jgi:hypothetical protein
MDDPLGPIFTESIRMERAMAALYRLYERLFPLDADFWHALSSEEENHAAVIRSGMDHFFEAGLFPLEALDPDLEAVRGTNALLEETIARYRREKPSLEEALGRALQFEDSTVEHYYRYVQKSTPDSRAVYLFQELSGYSEDHVARVRGLMEKHGNARERP